MLALVDSTQRAAALRAIAGEAPLDRYTAVRVQPVAYDFVHLLGWKHLVFERMGGPDEPYSVTSIDADEAHNQVFVTVKDSSEVAVARRALEALGVPRKALCIEVGEIIIGPEVQMLPSRVQPAGR